MALTILERPEGVILDSGISATATDGSGDVIINATSHGLADQEYVYVASTVENYNGFFRIGYINANSFRLYDPDGVTLVDYISYATGTIYPQISTHGWSAVHTPITYRISNNLYPVNSSDTTRNISSVTDYNGFSVLHLSGSLGSGVNSYDFVKITVPADTDLSGVYQIVEFVSPTVLIINLEYSTDNDFTSATALKHYNNYNVLVNVYAGINSSHEWTAQKPYELATTLQLIPDDNNEVFFSVNDILKSYVKTRNNPTLGTMPNNIDFWANFYIETAESYDDSDGYSFGTYTSPYTSDQSNFEGVAVNSKLEFKNIYSGYLSEYLMTNNQAKFLTLFVTGVLFSCGDNTPDCYSDISFLLQDQTEFIGSYLRKQYYLNGNLGSTVNDSITDQLGVIRMPLEADCNYDRVDITVLGGEQLLDEPTFEATGDWLQTITASSDWTISGGMATVAMSSFVSSEYLYQSISGSAGTYRIITNLSTVDGGSGANDWQSVVHVYFFTGGTGGSVVADQTIGTLAGSTVGNTPTIDFDGTISVPGSFDTIAIRLLGSGPYTDSFTGQLLDLMVAAADQPISETKTFDIDCGCANQEIRLTWLNNLGGFDYWAFTAQKDHIIEIQQAFQTKKNIFPQWGKSYGEMADTIRKQTSRTSNKAYTVRAQHLTESQVDAISYIKSSVLVQIVNSRTDRRTVIVDTDSFIKYKDGDKTHTIAFNISFTDNIPSQTA